MDKKSPFAEVLKWGTADSDKIDFAHAKEVETWIDQKGLFYAGARAAGANDEEAMALINDPNLRLDIILRSHPELPADLGTLGYFAYKSVTGEADG